MDADNNNPPKELEDKFIEKCLDIENFDALNKYFSRVEQSNIDIVKKILNSGHKNAFTYVKDCRNFHGIISDIYEGLDDIENEGVKIKVMKCFVEKVINNYKELHKLHRDLQLMVENKCVFDLKMKKKYKI